METAERRFQLLFEGLNRARGQYTIDPDLSDRQEKVAGKAKTVSGLEDEHWVEHWEGKTGLGIIPIRDDQCCVFAALDIDEYDLDLKKLNQEAKECNLPLVLCRTKSGGAHLYAFFEEPIRCEAVIVRMREFARAIGYPAVEIFPKQRKLEVNGIGNWINLPYFNINGPTNRYALDDKGKALPMLEQFVAYAESRKVSKDEFLNGKIKSLDKVFGDGPPCLQRLAMQKHGFPSGTRNNALFNIGVYLKKKYVDIWRDKLEEFNINLMNPPLKAAEVLQTQRSLDRVNYTYKCEDEPICNFCNRLECSTRKYGIGNAEDAELEGMLGTLQKTVTLDPDGKPIVDDRPEWYMTVDGIQITLRTLDLFSQDKFLMKLAETLMKYPRRVPNPVWQRILKEKIESATTVEVPMDSGVHGKVIDALRLFVAEYGDAEDRLEVEDGLVWRSEDGFLHFKPSAFWDYLVRKRIYSMKDDGKELNRIMKKLGAERKQFWLGGPKNLNRHVWYLPDFTEAEKEQEIDPRKPKAEF